MERNTAIALGTLTALALFAINAHASYVSGDAPPMLPPPDSATLDAALSEIQMQPDPQSAINAFLNMIGEFESHGDYTVLYGGAHFADFSAHPNVRVPFYNPRKAGAKGVPNDYSTAAGKYQINFPTYLQYAPRLGVSDFSPATQDQLAYLILNDIGADTAVANGDIATALALASRKWASLPGSSSGQHQQSYQTALDTFNQMLNSQG